MLATEAGQQLLTEVSQIRSIGPSDITRLRKASSPAAVSAAIRLSLARKKASLKFVHGPGMWVELTAVEQSTSEPVARHKAARFVCPRVVDLCAGIGGDALALAAHADVLAVDLDQGMCRRLAYNASVYNVADRILPVRARAEDLAIPAGAWLHLDSDRRANGHERARLIDDYAPGPDFWKAAMRQVAAGAIKLGPASDFAKHFAGPEFEVELISLRGECKEATVWFGELVSCRRRATRLPEAVFWTDRDGPTERFASVTPVGTLIFDPDPSLLRAGLLDGFALAHGLTRVADGVDYLTGERLMSTAFLSAFQVLDVSPLDLKRLRRLISKHEIGTLEIKVRGRGRCPGNAQTTVGTGRIANRDPASDGRSRPGASCPGTAGTVVKIAGPARAVGRVRFPSPLGERVPEGRVRGTAQDRAPFQKLQC